MNENENLQPVEKLTPFTKMIMTIGTLPSSFYASMSYYESMVWLYEYLKNEVIPTVNNNAEAVEELQEKYIEFSGDITEEVSDFKEYINGKVDELETYMNNYFTNLDVQQEINNKLDAMATDGTLTNLIKNYVDPIYQAYENEINLDINNFKNTINTEVGTLSNKVSNLTSNTPAGVYATLSDLETDDPNHNYIYVVTGTGNWYYYNTSTTSWTSGGTYQATLTPDSDMARINETYSEVKNTSVTNLSTYYHYFINSYSPYAESSTDSARTSDYLICQGYNKIKYKTSLNSSGFELLFYDRNKTFLPNISILGDSVTTEKTVNVPATAYYVRLSAYGDSYYSTAYINIYLENSNNARITTNANNITKLNNELQLNETIINELKSLKVYKVFSNIDGYVQYSDGSLVEAPSSSMDKRTDYILVKGYKILEYYTRISSEGAEIAFFNQNKEYLQNISIQGQNSYITNKISIPDTAYYVILSQYADIESYISLYNEDYNYKTPILNKNILIFGDSITECTEVSVNSDYETTDYYWYSNPSNKYWPWLLNKYFYAKEIRNYALSGATYSKLESYTNKRASLIDQVTISINDKNNPNSIFKQNTFTPDIVIFAAGTNQHNIGTYNAAMSKTIYESDNHTIDVSSTLANLDQTKEIEAARYCFMKIKNEWPMAQIYVVLPIQRMSRNQLENGMNIELPKLAERYGAIIINGCDNGIVQEGNVYDDSGTTLADGLHPNQNGQYLMFRQIYKSLENNYFDYSIFE